VIPMSTTVFVLTLDMLEVANADLTPLNAVQQGWGFRNVGKNAVRISFGPLVNNISKIEEGIIKISKILKQDNKKKSIGKKWQSILKN